MSKVKVPSLFEVGSNICKLNPDYLRFAQSSAESNPEESHNLMKSIAAILSMRGISEEEVQKLGYGAVFLLPIPEINTGIHRDVPFDESIFKNLQVTEGLFSMTRSLEEGVTREEADKMRQRLFTGWTHEKLYDYLSEAVGDEYTRKTDRYAYTKMGSYARRPAKYWIYDSIRAHAIEFDDKQFDRRAFGRAWAKLYFRIVRAIRDHCFKTGKSWTGVSMRIEESLNMKKRTKNVGFPFFMTTNKMGDNEDEFYRVIREHLTNLTSSVGPRVRNLLTGSVQRTQPSKDVLIGDDVALSTYVKAEFGSLQEDQLKSYSSTEERDEWLFSEMRIQFDPTTGMWVRRNFKERLAFAGSIIGFGALNKFVNPLLPIILKTYEFGAMGGWENVSRYIMNALKHLDRTQGVCHSIDVSGFDSSMMVEEQIQGGRLLAGLYPLCDDLKLITWIVYQKLRKHLAYPDPHEKGKIRVITYTSGSQNSGEADTSWLDTCVQIARIIYFGIVIGLISDDPSVWPNEFYVFVCGDDAFVVIAGSLGEKAIGLWTPERFAQEMSKMGVRVEVSKNNFYTTNDPKHDRIGNFVKRMFMRGDTIGQLSDEFPYPQQKGVYPLSCLVAAIMGDEKDIYRGSIMPATEYVLHALGRADEFGGWKKLNERFKRARERAESHLEKIAEALFSGKEIPPIPEGATWHHYIRNRKLRATLAEFYPDFFTDDEHNRQDALAEGQEIVTTKRLELLKLLSQLQNIATHPYAQGIWSRIFSLDPDFFDLEMIRSNESSLVAQWMSLQKGEGMVTIKSNSEGSGPLGGLMKWEVVQFLEQWHEEYVLLKNASLVNSHCIIDDCEAIEQIASQWVNEGYDHEEVSFVHDTLCRVQETVSRIIDEETSSFLDLTLGYTSVMWVASSADPTRIPIDEGEAQSIIRAAGMCKNIVNHNELALSQWITKYDGRRADLGSRVSELKSDNGTTLTSTGVSNE